MIKPDMNVTAPPRQPMLTLQCITQVHGTPNEQPAEHPPEAIFKRFFSSKLHLKRSHVISLQFNPQPQQPQPRPTIYHHAATCPKPSDPKSGESLRPCPSNQHATTSPRASNPTSGKPLQPTPNNNRHRLEPINPTHNPTRPLQRRNSRRNQNSNRHRPLPLNSHPRV